MFCGEQLGAPPPALETKIVHGRFARACKVLQGSSVTDLPTYQGIQLHGFLKQSFECHELPFGRSTAVRAAGASIRSSEILQE